jgi:hypothetical protein
VAAWEARNDITYQFQLKGLPEVMGAGRMRPCPEVFVLDFTALSTGNSRRARRDSPRYPALRRAEAWRASGAAAHPPLAAALRRHSAIAVNPSKFHELSPRTKKPARGGLFLSGSICEMAERTGASLIAQAFEHTYESLWHF